MGNPNNKRTTYQQKSATDKRRNGLLSNSTSTTNTTNTTNNTSNSSSSGTYGINYSVDTRYQNAPGQALTPSQLEARNRIINSTSTTTSKGPNSNTDEWRAYITAGKSSTNPSFNYGNYTSNYSLPGYSAQTLSHIGSFTPSQAYTDAMNYTNQLLAKLNTGRTSYSDKVDEMMNTIANRDKFSYDMDKDPMFQQYLQSSMDKGKIAMQDTIGQASALTGGYGSTYATAAANGAYNQYVQEAYDNVTDYYGMALDAYNQEGQELYNQLGMYQNADNTEYSRLSNAYSANLSNAQTLYSQEYSNYWDTANYNMNVDQFNASERYKAAQMAQKNAQYKQNMAYKQYQDALSALTSSSASSSSGTTDSELKSFLTATNNKNTLAMLENLYFNGGDAEGSDYDVALSRLYDQGYDPAEVDAYIKSAIGGNSTYTQTTNKFGTKNDTYTVTLPSGGTKTVSYAELQELLKVYPNLRMVEAK